jgi:hypothetical protein
MLHKSLHQSLCLYVYPLIVARQRLSKNPLILARQQLGKKGYRVNKYTRNNRITAGRVVLYAVRVV